MKDKPGKRTRPADRLAELVADELLAVSGQELEGMVREWGLEPKEAAQNVDAAFKEALKRRSKARLEEAKRTREKEVAKLSGGRLDLPTDREELLVTLKARLAEIDSSQVTIQHRDFNDLTECDIRSLIRQLSALEKREPSGNGNA